jgi:hypothetical protein
VAAQGQGTDDRLPWKMVTMTGLDKRPTLVDKE